MGKKKLCARNTPAAVKRCGGKAHARKDNVHSSYAPVCSKVKTNECVCVCVSAAKSARCAKIKKFSNTFTIVCSVKVDMTLAAVVAAASLALAWTECIIMKWLNATVFGGRKTLLRLIYTIYRNEFKHEV